MFMCVCAHVRNVVCVGMCVCVQCMCVHMYVVCCTCVCGGMCVHVQNYVCMSSPFLFPPPSLPLPPPSPRRNNLLQLILSRSHLPVAVPTDPTQRPVVSQHGHLPGQLEPLLNLYTLQEDVLVTCLAGLPLIEQSSVSSLRIPFRFKDDSSAQFRWVWRVLEGAWFMVL